MCYHKSEPERTELDDLFDYAVRTDEWDKYYYHLSGFSFQKIPVLTCEKPDRIQAFNWGLIPSWVPNEQKAMDIRMYTLNAKSETIFQTPSFKNVISSKRCLIFANGFFEPHTFNKKKYTFYIGIKSQKTFALAGIYDEWVNKETGEIHKTCSIITMQPQGIMSKIHNKMEKDGTPDPRTPIILNKENMMNWIKPNLNKDEIISMFKEYPDDDLKYFTVSQFIHNKKEDTNQEKAITHVEFPELVNSPIYQK